MNPSIFKSNIFLFLLISLFSFQIIAQSTHNISTSENGLNKKNFLQAAGGENYANDKKTATSIQLLNPFLITIMIL